MNTRAPIGRPLKIAIALVAALAVATLIVAVTTHNNSSSSKTAQASSPEASASSAPATKIATMIDDNTGLAFDYPADWDSSQTPAQFGSTNQLQLNTPVAMAGCTKTEVTFIAGLTYSIESSLSSAATTAVAQWGEDAYTSSKAGTASKPTTITSLSGLKGSTSSADVTVSAGSACSTTKAYVEAVAVNVPGQEGPIVLIVSFATNGQLSKSLAVLKQYARNIIKSLRLDLSASGAGASN